MNTTKQRIAAHKEKLPRVKEKLVAMIALLVLSATMLTTVSFAWLTLSANPEVTGVSMAVAANGNLEVALANGTKLEPHSSQIGDGSLGILERNTTWGNLINLSDAAYGLDNMVLRPALLYEADLLNSPLRAAVYSADGRVSGMDSNFRYAKWTIYDESSGYNSAFELTDQYGLRAITSTVYSGQVGPFNKKQAEYQEAMDKANSDAIQAYMSIINNEAYINSLVNLMGHYMTARMNSGDADIGNPSFQPEDAENLRDIFAAFVAALEIEQQYMLAAANYQIFLQTTYAEGSSFDITLEQLLKNVAGVSGNTVTTVKTGKTGFNNKEVEVKLYGLASNVRDLSIVKDGYEKLKTLVANGGPYTWAESGINNILNSLVNVGTCQVYNPDSGTVTIGSMGVSDAFGYLNKNNNEAIITNGVLFNYEQRTGADMAKGSFTKDRTIKVTVKRYGMTLRDQKVQASLRTNAEMMGYPADRALAESLLPDALKNANTSSVELRADATYGYVIDFWIRTNAANSYLKLEGNVLTEEERVDAKGQDPDGKEVQLYTVTETVTEEDGSTSTLTRDVYYKDVRCNITIDAGVVTSYEESASGSSFLECWYYHDDHAEYPYYRVRSANAEFGTGTWYQFLEAEDGTDTVTVREVTNMTAPNKKVIINEHVIGYEGENRVWDEEDSALISINSTTQGSGSCYVFYADTVEDQERGLELLKALKVAFVDIDGDLLAEAYLDTERCYSDAGKIIVPLVLTEKNIVKNEETNESYSVITALEKNEAMLISAVVYLDGQLVSNDDVLATSNIQGQFNIQFGNTVVDINLDPAPNEKLESEQLSISATVDKMSFNYDTDTSFDVTVTANIDGVEPNRVEAFFIRTITPTQGVKLETFLLTGSGTTWTGQFTFSSPGEYILRSLRIDGVEYDLEVGSRPRVTVEGFAINGISWGEGSSNYHRFMTSAGSVSTNLTVRIGATPENRPDTVIVRFHNQADNTNTYSHLTYDPTEDKWTGTITFNTSGKYVLDMLTIDGNQTAVDSALQKTAEVICGMKVAVYTTSPQLPKRIVLQEGISTDDELNLKMQLKILDNNGSEIKALNGVNLYYGRKNYVSDEVGMFAAMQWNADSGYYEGILEAQTGDYEFLKVAVGDSEITSATTSPEFSILKITIPGVLEWTSIPYQFGGAAFTVQMTEDTPDAAVIEAVVVNADTGAVTTVQQKEKETGSGSMWSFELAASGTYYIRELHVRGCFNANGDWIEPNAEEYYLLSVNTDESIAENGYVSGTKVSVVKEFNVEVKYPDQTIEGGAFLAAQPWQNIVTITPDLATATAEISDVKLTFKYSYDKMQEYGGYSTTNTMDLLDAVAESILGEGQKLDSNNQFTITLTKNVEGQFVIDRTLTYAGDYTLTKVVFTAEVGGTTKTVTMTLTDGKFTTEMNQDLAMSVKVKSEKPTVTITNIAPRGSHNTIVQTSSDSAENREVTSSFTETTATVYCHNTFDSSKDSCTGAVTGNATIEQKPYVTISLTGIGAAEKATVVFSGSSSTILMYTDENYGTQTAAYEWTSNTTCTRYIGKYQEGACSSDMIQNAGTLTATTMQLTGADGVTYIVSVNLTIHNPLS